VKSYQNAREFSIFLLFVLLEFNNEKITSPYRPTAALPANCQVTLDRVPFTGGISITVDDFDSVYTVNALSSDITLMKRDPASALL
jgi:hypothetical protein